MDALNTFQDVYVCTNYIRNEQKLRIQVARPNYNLRDLEHANVVLSVSVHVNEAADEGPPRYYAIGSGTDDVIIKDLYMTNLDRVNCLPPYKLVNSIDDTDGVVGSYQACELDCHEECAGGCNKVADPRKVNLNQFRIFRFYTRMDSA